MTKYNNTRHDRLSDLLYQAILSQTELVNCVREDGDVAIEEQKMLDDFYKMQEKFEKIGRV